MSSSQSKPPPAKLPPARSWAKRLRHRRRDLLWRVRLRRQGIELPVLVRHDPAFPELAVVAIAISPKYHDWCLSMLDSLRAGGRYTGPVYVATEDPTPFAGLDNVATIVVPGTRHQLIIKTLKTLLPQWLTERFLLYIDADIIVAKPLKAWLEQALKRLESHPFLAYPDDKPIPGSYHGGFFLIDRKRALPFINQWRRKLRGGFYLRDQSALKSVEDTNAIGYFLDQELIYLHTCIDLKSGERHVSPTCFVHVTNGMIRQYPPEKLQQYMRSVLGVRRMPTSLGR